MKGTVNPDGPFSRGVQKGAAYVYRRSATTGLWYEQTKLFLDDGEGTDRYGWQVRIPPRLLPMMCWASMGENIGVRYVRAPISPLPWTAQGVHGYKEWIDVKYTHPVSPFVRRSRPPRLPLHLV